MGLQIRRRLGAWVGYAILAVSAAPCRADDSSDAYHVALGPGFYQEPTFPGSRHERNIYFPFLDAELDNRFYTSASDLLGVYAVKTVTTQLGSALEYDLTERLSRDVPRLHDFPNVKQTPRAKAFASETVWAFTGDVNVATDVSGRGEGTVGQANLWLTVPVDKTFSINVGPGLTWADSHYMNAYFRVTPDEALANRVAPYAAHAGLLDSHFNGLAEWLVAAHYRIGVQMYLSRLQRNADESPIVLQNAQRTLVGWLAYKFR